jgi:hypothetical protein
MTTLIGVAALSAYVAVFPLEPSWHSDYPTALVQGAHHHKPLAVFLAPGKEAWNKLIRDGTLSPEAQRLLRSSYVAVYLDTDTPDGKELASSLEMPGGVGLVLSDREGLRQAFWHEGALEDQELTSALARHADPEGPMVMTETNQVTRTSSYGPAAAPASPAPTYSSQPAFRFQPAYSASCSH